MVAKFFQLQTNLQYPQESGSATPVYCHGVLLLYGGSCLGPDTFLQRPVPPELHRAVAHKPLNALYLRFPLATPPSRMASGASSPTSPPPPERHLPSISATARNQMPSARRMC
eukprot:TRINITY_DN12782_c0_g1_i1.p4 TRINITY_DN12782_c0_g1~~TRINITY_DN12782_c0_g1_i1.p4  ORF type:complete len:113 (+),score=12.32 TRINITY_DN12782_c0_g1_i1:158-496(+)